MRRLFDLPLSSGLVDWGSWGFFVVMAYKMWNLAIIFLALIA